MDAKSFLRSIFVVLGILSSTSFASDALSFQKITLSGTGCKNGTYDVVASPNNRQLSILFDEFSTEVPVVDFENDNDSFNDGETRERVNARHALDRKVCQIEFAVKVPINYKISSLNVGLDFRGFVYTEEGVSGMFRSVILDQSGMGMRRARSRGAPGLKFGNLISQKVWGNPSDIVDEDWTISKNAPVQMNSKCATNSDRVAKFRIRNVLLSKLSSSALASGATGMLSLDTTDVDGAKFDVKVDMVPCMGNTRNTRGTARLRDHQRRMREYQLNRQRQAQRQNPSACRRNPRSCRPAVSSRGNTRNRR